jgi:hypothetical protein
MKSKIMRRGTGKEILSIPNAPYITTKGKDGREAERKYVQSCLALLDRETKRHPGVHVKLSVRGGVPYFTYIKRSLTEQTLRKRINRALGNVKSGVKNGIGRDALVKRIDRAIKKVEDLQWEE